MSTYYFCSGVGIGKCIATFAASLPTNWELPGFDDSSWGLPVARTLASGDNFHFSINVVDATGADQPCLVVDNTPQVPPGGTHWNFAWRNSFVLPKIIPGLTIASIVLEINAYPYVDMSGGQPGVEGFAGVWINGNAVAFAPPYPSVPNNPWYLTFPASYLMEGKNVVAAYTYITTAYNTGYQFGLTITISEPPPDWLIVAEPVVGIVDQSQRLFLGDDAQHSFTLQARQRGSATYTLVVRAGDTYSPTNGSPMWLWDQNAAGFTLVFRGLIQDFKNRQIGTNGDRYIDCTATSLEVVFDTVYAEPMQFVGMTCDAILVALYNAFEGGCPVGLGTITPSTVAIPLFVTNYEKLSDLFTQLATTAQYTWGVDPQTSLLFFCPPSEVAAPLELTSNNALWDTIDWSYDSADYRNRQAVRLSYDAFAHSMEYFQGTNQTSFTLMRPVNQVTNCYITLSTCNTAIGVFSGQPAVGDTVTIGPYTAAVWQASHVYAVDGVIVVNGYVQKVTTAGTSGSTIPAFNQVTGGTYQDNSVIWTCQGLLNLATGLDTYTFVLPLPELVWAPATVFSTGLQIVNEGFVQQATTGGTSGSATPSFSHTTGGTVSDGTVVWTCKGVAMDNTQFGQVAIDPNSDTYTCQNLVDAINSNAAVRGTTFSLPTWECTDCIAVDKVGAQFTLQQKGAGSGWISSVGTTSTNFTWQTAGSPSVSTTRTTGGTSPQGSVGPNEGATISIQVYAEGTSTASPGLSYTQGSAAVNLATPLVAGTNMNIEYTRMDGDVIEVEDTELVLDLANATYGTGKYQQITDQSSQGLVSTSSAAGLQLAQQALAAYDVVPFSFEVEILQAGVLPGQEITVNLTGALSVLNGTYFVEEVTAQLVPVWPYMDNAVQCPAAGHYRYTIKLINITQIASYMDFWEGFGGGGGAGGGGGGAGGGSSLVATSGGTQPTQGTALTVGTVNEVTANYSAVSTDYGKLLVFNSASALTLTLPVLPFVPPFPQWWIQIQNIGAGTLTIQTTSTSILIDGINQTIARGKNGGIIVTSDGANFFTERAGPLLETNGTINQDQGTLNLAAGAGITLTQSAGTTTIAGGGAGGSALVQIAQVVTTASAATVTFSGIPGSYSSLMIKWVARGLNASSSGDLVYMNLNGDATTAYNWNYINGETTAAGYLGGSTNPDSKAVVGAMADSGDVTNNVGAGNVEILGYALTLWNKNYISLCSYQSGAAGSQVSQSYTLTGCWRNTAAITSIVLSTSSTDGFVNGSVFTLYGVQ